MNVYNRLTSLDKLLCNIDRKKLFLPSLSETAKRETFDGGDICAESLGRAQVSIQNALSVGLEKLTQPSEGRAENYRFLVHAVNPTNPAPGNEFFKKARLSCSLIDDAHPSTYGEFGFILDIPSGNIQRMLPEAGGTNVDGLIQAMGGRIDRSLMTFDELLSKTRDALYNEIVVTQNENNKITGVFCKILSDGTPVSKEAYDKALVLSKQRNCPLVLIPEKGVPFKMAIAEYKGHHYLFMQNNALTYYIELGQEFNADMPFRVTSPNRFRKMTREEFEQMLSLVQENIPKDQLTRFKTQLELLRSRFEQQV